TQVAARDYGAAVTPAMSEAAATTPAQAVVLSQTVAIAPVALSNGAALAATPADPSVIALAKLDILLNQSVQSELAKQGIGGTNGIANILGAGTLSASDGRAIKSQTISLDALGITSANGVAFLVYVPDANGVMQPRVIKPRFRKGKLQVSLPVPCEYNVIQNVALPAAAN
ncbi:MAG: hypothetical protein IJ815_02795, partial [Lachnospiraceae bacterium]|nr:hypothetical protein [Lachnospiraceae bacterium]